MQKSFVNAPVELLDHSIGLQSQSIFNGKRCAMRVKLVMFALS